MGGGGGRVKGGGGGVGGGGGMVGGRGVGGGGGVGNGEGYIHVLPHARANKNTHAHITHTLHI